MSQFMLPELNAMQQISELVSSLTPGERRRVAAWFAEYASQECDVPAQNAYATDAQDATVTEEVASEALEQDSAEATEQAITSFSELFVAVAPKKGAQKAAVAGYWLEVHEGATSWKASEVNNLLKSIDVKVSSMSIVLTNAVKAKTPLIRELDRLGDSARSRKTFCLSEQGRAYVESQRA